MRLNRAWKRRLNHTANRANRRNAAHVLARLEVLAVTSVNAAPFTDEQLLAALNPVDPITGIAHVYNGARSAVQS